MSRIEFNRKPRKDGGGMFFTDGHQVFIGRDYLNQNDINETLEKTRARSCFRGCRTCGACANSRRDATVPKSYDYNAGKMIDCRSCEKYRYHDCHNGWMRDTRQQAEPFTPDMIKLLEESGGKPLI